jgi:hypothetical protein
MDDTPNLSRAGVCCSDLLDEREARSTSVAYLRGEGNPRVGIAQISNPKLTSVPDSLWLVRDTDGFSWPCLINTPGQPEKTQLFTGRATNRDPVLHPVRVYGGTTMSPGGEPNAADAFPQPGPS